MGVGALAQATSPLQAAVAPAQQAVQSALAQTTNPQMTSGAGALATPVAAPTPPTWYQSPEYINGSWDFRATQDKAAAQAAVDAAQGMWNQMNPQTLSSGLFGGLHLTNPDYHPLTLTPVDMKYANNMKGLGLSDQSMANLLSTYQYQKQENPGGAGQPQQVMDENGNPTGQWTAANGLPAAFGGKVYNSQAEAIAATPNYGSQIVRPYDMTPEDLKKLGIAPEMSYIANFDPTKANANANNWNMWRQEAHGGFGGGIMQGLMNIGKIIAPMFLGPAGVGADAAGAGAEALATEGLGALPQGVGAAANIGGTAGMTNLSMQAAANAANGVMQAGMGVGAGAGALSPYIGNSIKDLAVTNPTGSVPTNNWLENQIANLSGNGTSSALSTAKDLYTNANLFKTVAGALFKPQQQQPAPGSSSSTGSPYTTMTGPSLNSYAPQIGQPGNMIQPTQYPGFAQGGLAQWRGR